MDTAPAIAHLVEHLQMIVECCRHQVVPGSIPGRRIIFLTEVAWSGSDARSSRSARPGVQTARAAQEPQHGESRTPGREHIAGSVTARSTPESWQNGHREIWNSQPSDLESDALPLRHLADVSWRPNLGIHTA